MKYGFSRLPSTGHARKYRVKSHPAKSEMFFHIDYSVIGIWGNPAEGKLEQFMIAHIKKNGWAKAPVEIKSANAPKDLSNHIKALTESAAKK